MIEERKRMTHYRSYSADSLNQRSRTPSHDDADDEDFNESDTSVTKRRIRKKKKPQQQSAQQKKNQVHDDDDDEDLQNFDNIRRRLSR
jgi:hypothetical protein